MTYKEALAIVVRLDLDETRALSFASKDNGLRTVCGWRLEEPDAFEEIAMLAGVGMTLPPERPTGDALLQYFTIRPRSYASVAEELRTTRKWVGNTLRRVAEARGYELVMRKVKHGCEFQAVQESR